MKRYSAGIDIDATPEAVWAVLADTAHWAEFDPNTERFEGQAALGQTVTLYSTLAPGRTFPVKITALERPKTLAWAASMSLGTLKVVRTHTLSPRSGGCRFEVNEEISGPMLGVMSNALPNLTEPFAAFCRGLKARVEGQPLPQQPAPATGPDRFLRMERRFAASPERVFDAWLDPALTRQWLFAMPSDESYAAQLDPRPGGHWTIAARRGGLDYTATGEYLEIDRPRKLVFTFEMRQFSPNSDRITVEIVPDGAGCRLTFTQAGVDIASELRQLPPGVKGGSETGWENMFDYLTAVLK